MTEAEWLASNDPSAMLRYLTRRTEDLEEKTTIYPSDRKLRLLMYAVCPRSERWTGEYEVRNPGEFLRGYLSGWKEHRVFADTIRAIVGNPFSPYTLALEYRTPLVLSLVEAAYARQEACPECAGEGEVHDADFSDGDSDRQMFIKQDTLRKCPACAGRGTTDRDDGTLDPQRMAILADALEDAGVSEMVECPGCIAILQPYSGGLWPCRECGAASWQDRGRIPNPLLARLRSAGPFYRGEASLDVVLGKE